MSERAHASVTDDLVPCQQSEAGSDVRTSRCLPSRGHRASAAKILYIGCRFLPNLANRSRTTIAPNSYKYVYYSHRNARTRRLFVSRVPRTLPPCLKPFRGKGFRQAPPLALHVLNT